jgi:1-acyl-sn-glycerol-3-phosphate acyltransferase
MMEWCNGSGKEHALVISNHRSDIDWLVGWIIAQVSSSLSLSWIYLLSLFTISFNDLILMEAGQTVSGREN